VAAATDETTAATIAAAAAAVVVVTEVEAVEVAGDPTFGGKSTRSRRRIWSWTTNVPTFFDDL